MRIPSIAEAALPLSGLGADRVAKRGDGHGATIWATPHDSYSSSIGVPGCKINTNRVAYWPQAVDCDNVCVAVEYEHRQVHLLRVDQSTGAHDISYDAWNYLYIGESAMDKPTAGGAVEMKYRNVDASKCASLIHTEDHKLPISAANGMNFLASCLQRPTSWVANNHVVVNIVDSICTLGVDEQCNLDWPEANQPTCPHTLGQLAALKDDPVYNIQYPSGKKVLATSGASGTPLRGNGASGSDENAAPFCMQPSTSFSSAIVACICLFLL